MPARVRSALFAIALLVCPASFAAPVPRAKVLPVPPTRERLATTPRDGTRLLLAGAVYDPLREELDFAPWGFAPLAGDDLGVVQLRKDAAVSADTLAAKGLPVLGYVPDSAFLVRLTPEVRKALDAWPAVRWYGPLVPGLRVSPGLWAGPRSEAGELEIQLVRDAAPSAPSDLSRRLRGTGALETSRLAGPGFARLRFAVPASALDAFVRLASVQPEVLFIDVRRRFELHNNDSLGPLQSGVASAVSNGTCATCGLFSRGLFGTGQIVAVADSGNDSDMCFFRSWNGTVAVTAASAPLLPAPGPLFPTRKVVGYFVQPGATAYDNNAICSFSATGFHGTHVSATAVGDDLARPSSPAAPGIDTGDGMAPQAQLLFQDIGNDTTGCLSGLGDIAGTLEQARLAGARVHSNSWGARAFGIYTGDDQVVDAFLFDHDEMAVFFSAGNSGPNPTTLASPGIAKNVVTVGSLGHGASTTVSTFSSRGPAADGRIKPDLVAPGEDIVSAAGSATQGDLNCATKTLSGTSMSCPAVAGAAALVRQYLAAGFHPTGTATPADALLASGPLVKAILMNGAAPVGSFGSGDTGWGRPNLDANLYFPGDARSLRLFAVANADGLTTGEARTYTITIPPGAQELRATLVWFDAEGSPGAAVALVNDLDLTVSDGLSTFRGNVLDGSGASQPGGVADVRNTVEQVRLPAPAAGAATITVTASSVPGNGRSNTARQ
ncbi:MAG: S8 family serine peptidase, partial [Acidobacteria bacterium]|nr:S8 family serine peptidase [Acidobacteriota bacterium]